MITSSITVGHGSTPIWIATDARPHNLVITAVSDEPYHCGGPSGDPTISDIRITRRGFGFTITVPGAVATVTWRYTLSKIEDIWSYWLTVTRNEVAASILVLAELLIVDDVPSTGLPAKEVQNLKAVDLGHKEQQQAGSADLQAVRAVRDLLGVYVDQRKEKA